MLSSLLLLQAVCDPLRINQPSYNLIVKFYQKSPMFCRCTLKIVCLQFSEEHRRFEKVYLRNREEASSNTSPSSKRRA